MEKSIVTKITWMIMILLLTSCSTTKKPALKQPPNPNYPSLNTNHTALWEGQPAQIWNHLQHNSPARLASMQNAEQDPVKKTWIELALISKRNSANTSQLAYELLAWRSRNPYHPANPLLPDNATLNQLQSQSESKRIALLLPLQGAYGVSGQTIRNGFLNAYYKNLSASGKQNVAFYDTSQSQNIRALYNRAISDGADLVIGPLIKNDVEQLSHSGAFASQTLALNYTRPNTLPENFYEFGLLPEDEAVQIAKRARQRGLSRAIIISPQDTWGEKFTSLFSAHWQMHGGKILESWRYTAHSDFNQEIASLLHIDPRADKKLMQKNNNKTILAKQRRQDFDVIFLFAKPQEAHVIVPLLRYYYVTDVPIFASSAVYSGKPNPASDVDLNGVTVCDIPWSIQVANTINDETQSDRLYAVGQDAYLLSLTLQRLVKMPNFPIYGTTGALTLASSHQIHRRLPCTVIHNGRI